MQRNRAFRDQPIEGQISTEGVETVSVLSDKQLAFINSLFDQKDLGEKEPFKEQLRQQAKGISKKDASKWIDRLKSMPNLQVAQAPSSTAVSFPEVADGRYALRAEDGVVKFYRVRTPEKGKWSGYTFVDAQASDDYYPIKDKAHRSEILAAIAQDPKGATVLYGHELGCCGVCGRTLTDEKSRELGIGPVCIESRGW